MKNPQDMDQQTGVMQEKMLWMHEQMHKIMQSKDAKEREKLMQEHSKMMQDNVSMMQGMMGGDAKDQKMGRHERHVKWHVQHGETWCAVTASGL